MLTHSGLYINEKDKDRLMLGGNPVYELLPQNKKKYYGFSSSGSKLLFGGVTLVNDGSKPVLTESNDSLHFGDVLITSSGTCVNITAEDYSKLMSGDIPRGYCRHREGTIYNIVDSVASASKITYTVANNVITFSTGKTTSELNTVLYNNVPTVLSHNAEDLTATVTSTRCPFVNTRHFDPVVNKNTAFDIEYHVDNKYNDWFNNGKIEDTYTVEVADESGNILVRRTTYSGVFKITVPAYSSIGEKTFTIRCIDSNGVGSPVEFLKVLVVQPTADVVEDMEDYLDANGNISFEYPSGTQWTITLKDENVITQEEAYNNKAALSNFFAMAAAGGATKVLMYNGGDTHYFIDYHKKLQNGTFGGCTYFKCTMSDGSSTTKQVLSVSEATFEELKSARTNERYVPILSVSTEPSVGNSLTTASGLATSSTTWYCVINSIGTRPAGGDYITFPDNMVIDLNGATLQAIQSNDIVSGFVLRLYHNTNTHIINGKVYGNYKNFNFLETSVNSGSVRPAEWLGVSDINGCKFCSFENLDMGWSVGYDGCTENSINWFDGSIRTPVLIGSSRIDLSNGQEVEDSSMITTDYKTCSGKEYIALGRIGYAGYQYAGTQREIFFSFYDSNKTYIKSYKGRLYLPVKVPSNASYFRVTGYGHVYQSGVDTSASAWSVQWKGSSENGSLAFADVDYCYGCSKINCVCHDTRTTAETGAAYCYLIDGCTYSDIGKEPPYSQCGWDAVTPLLADMEDTWQWGRNYTMRNCRWINSRGSHSYVVHYCTVFNFIGNVNIDLENRGGIEGGTIADNIFNTLSIAKTLKSLHPHVMYTGNTINTLSVSYEDYTATGEHVDKDISMYNTTIANENDYVGLSMRNSINGDRIYQ